MLVLTRSENQSIMIDHDVVVTILEIRGDQVRVGIQAPSDVGIYREEIFTALEDTDRGTPSSSDDAVRSLDSLPTDHDHNQT